jgi:hypothetical protein
MEVSGQLHYVAALLPANGLRYRLARRVGGTQSQTGHGGEEGEPAPTGN